MGFVEYVADQREVIVCEVSVSIVLIKCRRPGYLPRRLPFHGVLPMIHAYFTTTELLLLTCQVLKINIVNDRAEVYIGRRHRDGLDRNWLRVQSHG